MLPVGRAMRCFLSTWWLGPEHIMWGLINILPGPQMTMTKSNPISGKYHLPMVFPNGHPS